MPHPAPASASVAVGVVGFAAILLLSLHATRRQRHSASGEIPHSAACAAATQRESFSVLAQQQQLAATRLPCVLVCGPFGAGKTTLVRALMRSFALSADFSCAFLVNDFADLGVDLEAVREEQRSDGLAFATISRGCMCCVQGEGGGDQEVERAIGVLSARRDVDCVLVEANGASGAAESRAVLAECTRLDRVLGVLDPEAFPPSTWSSGENDVKSFAQACDVILLNKSDVCDSAQVQHVKTVLESLGARDVRLTVRGEIPIPWSFHVTTFAPDRAEFGSTVAEKKATARYSLASSSSTAIPFSPPPAAALTRFSHNHTVRRTSIQDHHIVYSLRDLQYSIHEWWTTQRVERVKGVIALREFPHAVRFQYSGRGRTECIMEDATSKLPRETRLAIVFGDANSNGNEEGNDSLSRPPLQIAPHQPSLGATTTTIRTFLMQDSRVDVLPSPSEHLIRFSVTCGKKFGFSPEMLSMRFGVSITEVNRNFHWRVNSLNASFLIAFDGEVLALAPIPEIPPDSVCALLARELDACVRQRFAVVRHACNCDT